MALKDLLVTIDASDAGNARMGLAIRLANRHRARLVGYYVTPTVGTYELPPAAPLGFRLPFNLETGELIESRWKNWQKNDPIHMVKKHQANLRSLRGIYVDCGWRDQYHIHFGARILSLRLAEAGIAHRYEEFDDNHSDIDYRMDVSLPFLYQALKP